MTIAITVLGVPDDVDRFLMRYVADHKKEGITSKAKAIREILIDLTKRGGPK